MEFKPGLMRSDVVDVEQVRRDAERAGYTTFVLPADGIVDRHSFFDAVKATFPLDPPVAGSRSWDALSDSLWEGLLTHPARRIVILWSGTRAMATTAPSDFGTALNVLADVAKSLVDSRATLANPKEVAIIVEGGT